MSRQPGAQSTRKGSFSAQNYQQFGKPKRLICYSRLLFPFWMQAFTKHNLCESFTELPKGGVISVLQNTWINGDKRSDPWIHNLCVPGCVQPLEWNCQPDNEGLTHSCQLGDISQAVVQPGSWRTGEGRRKKGKRKRKKGKGKGVIME